MIFQYVKNETFVIVESLIKIKPRKNKVKVGKNMNKFVDFMIKFNKKINKDNVFGLSNELTYKIVLSIFPFLIFLMSLLGFINIKIDNLILEFSNTVPQQLLGIFNTFVQEVFYEKHVEIMSISLLLSIYSASSGFRAIMKGINKAHRQKEKRGFFVTSLISVGLVFLFTIVIIFSLILSISSEFLISILKSSQIFDFHFDSIFRILKYATLSIILFFTVTLIYKFSCCKKVKFKNIFPGVSFTVILWIISSKLYTIYIEKFPDYSKIYGSIGSVFVLLVWLDMMSQLLLIGSEINAFIEIKNF
ncbi:MAG: YihY/virulence factor BrkB family protein [Candidatus Paraimprobicoccus trichonymphae]|uniref:YihY/virulence factor BrkB family protein n=1 Tax=Candidatus Paraimprobicoccus trichonymphae TaxID=3033793 RepID=A0AA48KXG5_9FIRM|nr:MAG: YihY/virulence factor BrkB family protein [Candidatus Paraimprobicoccus trichonymphae]